MLLRPVFVYIVILCFFAFNTNAQNLVVNGGFEDFDSCPEEKGTLSNDTKKIKAPTRGSTDYFNVCGSKELGIPNNFKGEQKAYEGNAYAGLYLYSTNDYREYIQFELAEPLKKGQIYQISMRLSLAESSDIGLQEATVLFSKAPLYLDTNKNLSPLRLDRFKVDGYSYVNLKVNKDIFDDKKWAKVQTEFEAKGFEKYFTFGNFKNDKNSRLIQLGNAKKGTQMSYYYLDDVDVKFLREAQYEMNKPFVINQLQFEFDKFNLTEKAKQEVRKVYLHLKKNPKIQLSIYGHTDDLGTDEYNKYLSSRRARAVALYLQELGLDERRITWEGKGDKVPLFKSTSIKARDANRRVEFVITEFEDH